MALFGTDGIRGVANQELTPELALSVALSAARVLVKDFGQRENRPRAIVGNDSRASGELLEAAVIAGLTSAGVDVIRAGILPTPAIAFLVDHAEADLGVMISASHNPMPDNGIKIFARGGEKLSDKEEASIEALLNEPWERPIGGKVGRVISDSNSLEDYLAHLLSSISEPLTGIKVVVDCANGAASFASPEALRRAGAEVVAISHQPTGWNINDNCGSTHLENLQATVKEERADIGIAHDGDSDRCLAVDANGEIIDGDQIMAILATGALRDKKLHDNTIVATVMSNLGFLHAMRDSGIKVITTQVGDRYVLEKMLQSNFTLGGEQSGHLILRDFAKTGDGILTALALLQEMKRSGKSAAELARVMQRYPQVLINVRNVDKSKLAQSAVVARAIADAESKLADTGRVLLRASGTEPLIRVMVEAQSDTLASEIAKFARESGRAGVEVAECAGLLVTPGHNLQ
jgi:phosphoglucosamine mutase